MNASRAAYAADYAIKPTIQMCYVARRDCGCIEAALVDIPGHKEHNAKEVAKWIRDGYQIERVAVDYVRANLKHCPHKVNTK